jgi:hypothetical protein
MTSITSTQGKEVIARQWRGQIPLIAMFQFAGIFFILFYYSELVLSVHDWLAPDYVLRQATNASLLWIYNQTNSLQLLLFDKHHYLILISLFAASVIFATISITAIRRSDFGVLLRAVLFIGIGLLAIPAVLLAYVLRWVPGEIFVFFASIFTAIALVFSFIAPYVGYVMTGILGLGIVFVTVLWLGSTTIGRILLGLAVILVGSLYFHPETLESISSFVLGVWTVAGDIVAYPIAGLGYVFGIIASALAFIVSALIVVALSMFVFSQFGHMLIDSLFDARNVRRNARAAGRFLVGIGFLASTVVLCFPGNQLAQRGAAEAYVAASGFFGGNANYNEGAAFVADIGSTYLLVIPDEVETAIARAFSYGYPPSLELILVSISCLIAFCLIARQLAANDRSERLGLAFLPIELFFLLIGAALVVLLALAAAGDAES